MNSGTIYIDPIFLEQCRRNFLEVYKDAYPEGEFGRPSLQSLLSSGLMLTSKIFEKTEWTVFMPKCEELSDPAIDMGFEPFWSENGSVIELSRPSIDFVRLELEEKIKMDAESNQNPMILMIGSTGNDYGLLTHSSGHPTGTLQQRGNVVWIRDSAQPNPILPGLPWQSYVYAFGPSYGLQPEEL